MSWYYGTYSCGHEGRVGINGPTKDRQRKADLRFSGLCPECYKKEQEEKRAKENAEAAEKSAEMELPELTGTEKQVSWANNIRLKIIENLTEYLNKLEKYMVKNGLEFAPNTEITIEELHNAFDWFMISKTEARYWIDIRQAGVKFGDIVNEYRAHLDDEIHEDVLKEIEEEKENRTVSPECEEKKTGVVEIIFDSDESRIYAKYIKDSDFMEAVKSLGYRWSGAAWYKDINEYTGNSDDRAAELGNKLLLDGFTVQFPNVESKNMGISGNFALENDRWIKYRSDGEKLAVCWTGKNDILYRASKKLPGAYWKSGAMLVNIEFYKEILDFAETMGFFVSQTAQKEIEKYKKKESDFETANIIPNNENVLTDKERIEKSLKSNGTIIEDLIDDET